METITLLFHLHGLHCANCAAKIAHELEGREDVCSAQIHPLSYQLRLETTDVERTIMDWIPLIQKAVDRHESGVTVEAMTAGHSLHPGHEHPHQHEHGHESTPGQELAHSHHHGDGSPWKRLLYAGPALVFLLIFAFMPFLPLLYLAYLCLAFPVAREAVDRIRHGVFFDENLLMLLASLGALYLHEETEALAVLFFYHLGEAAQDWATARSRKALQATQDLRPQFARRVLEGGHSEEVAPESIQLGEVIEVHPGERIPLDGHSLEEASLDLQALTGESLPVSFAKGAAVQSGSIVLGRSLRLRVSHRLEDSTLSKLLRLTEESALSKAPTERFITRFARIYTPIVVGLAVVVSLLPPLLGLGTYNEWFRHALIFLVLSCPCALVLSVPLSYMAGMGRAAKSGIVIKGGRYLDALVHAKTLLLDKTGTLTEGRPQLLRQEIFDASVSKAEALRLAASLEQESSHPLAKALRLEAGKEQLELLPKAELHLHEETGLGVHGRVAGQGWSIRRPDTVLLERLSREDPLSSPLVLYRGEEAIASFFFRDQVKEGALRELRRLRHLGIQRLILLSGDRRPVVEAVARELELDHFEAELFPEEKKSRVAALVQEDQHVAYVGDGMNDAPSLALASVGIAMGAIGSEAALDAADVVLMQDGLHQLTGAFRMAHHTRRVAVQNILLSLGVKVVLMLLSFFVDLPLWLAVFGDVGVALLAILNAMRLLRLQKL